MRKLLTRLPDGVLQFLLVVRSFAPTVKQDVDIDVIRRRGWESSLGLAVGVAGISKPGTIKCLHTHFAHFLATGQNIVGKWVQEALHAGLHLPHVEARKDGAA